MPTEPTDWKTFDEAQEWLDLRGDRAFDAYYYCFRATGHDGVDAVLKAVAAAGKGYHNTQDWTEPYCGEMSYVDIIQRVADLATDAEAAPDA